MIFEATDRASPDDEDSSAPIIRGHQDLDEKLCVADDIAHIAGARVVWADWSALRRDFFMPDVPRDAIEGWLLDSAAVMSMAQWSMPKLAPPLHRRLRSSVAWRPPRYGRSAVVTTHPHPGLRPDSPRLLDVKGCGIGRGRSLNGARSENGLLLLPDALRELLTQKVIEHLSSTLLTVGIRCIPVYAVLWLGFDADIPERRHSPAACIVRAAHRRRAGNLDLPSRGSARQVAMLETEMALRTFGFTSASDDLAFRVEVYGEERTAFLGSRRLLPALEELLCRVLKDEGCPGACIIDRVNVQMSRDFRLTPLGIRLVDFGHYEFREIFDRPLLSLVNDRLLNWGGLLLPPKTDEAQARVRSLLAGKLGKVSVPKYLRDMLWDLEESESSGINVAAAKLAAAWWAGGSPEGSDLVLEVERFVNELPPGDLLLRAGSRNRGSLLSHSQCLD